MLLLSQHSGKRTNSPSTQTNSLVARNATFSVCATACERAGKAAELSLSCSEAVGPPGRRGTS